MYKLLIIDDDDMIRNGIKNAIEWSDHQIEEVLTAENGEKGEEIFCDFLPDIVLTDIKMPGIDGLELTGKMKNIKDDTKILILTGYDDFSYAQAALKLGAFDYLLKTADMDELLGVIDKAVSAIDRELKEKETYTRIKEQLKMSLPLLRYKYLNELINGYADMEQLVNKFELVDIKFDGACYIVAVSEIDDFAKDGGSITEEGRLMLKFQVINIMEDLLAQKGLCFETKHDEIVCIYNYDENLDLSGGRDLFMQKCEEITGAILRNLDLNLSMGISNKAYNLASLRLCYDEAKKALEHKLFMGKGSIIHIRDIASYTCADFQLDSDMKDRLASALRTGDKTTLLKVADGAFEYMNLQKNIGMANFYRICIELLSVASRVLSEFNISMEEVYEREFPYFEEIRKYKNAEDARLWVLSSLEKAVGYILNVKILKAKKIIATAKNYIDEHHCEELSLNKIAEFVHLSPNYFSSLFSNEFGQSFLEYVTSLRIEKAKQLLGEKDAKACEVGERVGYDNPYYFSRIFKKHTGMSPIEYKESLK